MSQFGDRTTEEILSDALARGDSALASVAPVLGHLLENDDQSLFTDEIVARMRGMLQHLARQLLAAQGEAGGTPNPADFSECAFERLTRLLTGNAALRGHVHALALEYRLCDTLQVRMGLDAVVPPVLQAHIGASQPDPSSEAMGMLTAQARFCQQQRRMELPLAELPEELFQTVLQVWKGQSAEQEQAHVAAAQAGLNDAFHAHESRLDLMKRFLASAKEYEAAALDVAHAGVPLFVTALARVTGQDRASAILALHDRRMMRLALLLRAAGASAATIERQLAWLHPDTVAPRGFDAIDAHQATLILAQSPAHAFG